jgi:hypothetical protein
MRRGVVRSLNRCSARLLAALPLVVATPAFGDDQCGRPDLLDTYPADGAAGVPTNATLTAHYAANAEYTGQPVKVSRNGAAAETPTASFDDTQGLLTITPALTAGDYSVAWPSLHGLGTSSAGSRATVSFTVGDSPDEAAPTFDGLAAISWDVERRHDSCTGSVEERFYFDLTPGSAFDDFGAEKLALTVFQTRGPGTTTGGAAVQVLIAPLPEHGTVRVERSIGDGLGEVCFAALVKDLAGHASGGADREVCTKTIPPPFFYGCQLTPPRDTPLGAASVPSVLALVFVLRRRHRRVS